MRKRFFTFLVLMFALVNTQIVRADIETICTSGVFEVVCLYHGPSDDDYEVYVNGIDHYVEVVDGNEVAVAALKNLVIPAKIHAKFESYNQLKGGKDLEGDFDFHFGPKPFIYIYAADTIIETISFEEGITEIPDQFYERPEEVDAMNFEDEGYSRLVQVNIPASVERIGKRAFRGHPNLDKVLITTPGSLHKICDEAFRAIASKEMGLMMDEYTYYSSLASINLPSTLNELEDRAFYGNTALKSITLGEDLMNIGEEVFAQCGLEEITLDKCGASPSSTGTFEGCPLKKVTVVPTVSTGYVAEIPSNFFAGVGYNSDPFELVFDKADEEYEAIYFQDHCFGSAAIKSITFPKKFVKGSYGYNIKFGVQSFISTLAFTELDLAAVTCAEDVLFEEESFRGSGIGKLTLNERTRTIDKNAFRASKVKEVVLPQYKNPSDVEEGLELNDGAFAATSFLESFEMKGTIRHYGGMNEVATGLFENSAIKIIKLHPDVTTIKEKAFFNSGLTEFVGGSKLMEIRDHAFDGCANLEKVDLTNSLLNSIEPYVFANTPALKNFSTPFIGGDIKGHAFDGCGIDALTINIAGLEEEALFNLPNLETLIFANPSCNHLYPNTIVNCPKLNFINFGNMHSLDGEFIINCPEIKELTITENLTTINKDAFQKIKDQIKRVTLLANGLGDAESADKGPFRDMMFELIIDPSITQIPKYAFARAVITNPLELRKDLNIDETAFAEGALDTLDWHYTDIKYPFLHDAMVYHMSFSKITELGDDLFKNGRINNIDLTGITKIGDNTFKYASLINMEQGNQLVIPGSVTSIGKNAFEDCEFGSLLIEEGSGLTIGDEAFYRSTPPAFAITAVTVQYPGTKIPTIAATTFKSGVGKIGCIYAGTCEDVDAYKAADNWKDVETEKWDGESQFHYSIEVIGEVVPRPIKNYYDEYIMVNGIKLTQSPHVGCDNKLTIAFASPCTAITFDHWNDPEAKDPSKYELTLTSDTVIKIYVKEKLEHLKMMPGKKSYADVLKFYGKTMGEWVEISEIDYNNCALTSYTDIKAELLDDEHYTWESWYTYDEVGGVFDPYDANQEIPIPMVGTTLYAFLTPNNYDFHIDLPMMDPNTDMIDKIYLNGVEQMLPVYASFDYGEEIEVEVVGTNGTGFRNVLNYWWMNDGETVSEDNPFVFKMPGHDITNLIPMMKGAGKFAISAKANDEALGTVKMKVADEDKVDDKIYERSPIELEAEVKGAHINFVKWNDDKGEESTKAIRTVYAMKDFEYVAIFEKDSFDVVINLIGGVDDKIVEVKGAGRYGWGDEVTLSFTLKDDHYHFIDWAYDAHSYTEETHKFTIEKNMNIDVHFNPNEYTITLVAEPTEGGTVSLDGATVYGTLVTLKAEPKEGYKFDAWKDDPSAEATRQVEVEGDATYTAVFKADTGTGIDQTTNDQRLTTSKVLREGHLFIERNGKTYDATGRLVK